MVGRGVGFDREWAFSKIYPLTFREKHSFSRMVEPNGPRRWLLSRVGTRRPVSSAIPGRTKRLRLIGRALVPPKAPHAITTGHLGRVWKDSSTTEHRPLQKARPVSTGVWLPMQMANGSPCVSSSSIFFA